MKLIDASGPIYEGMWSYGPPFPEFKIKELNNPEWVDFTAYSEEFIGLTSATGTYIDGPSHALGLDKSYAIGDIPIEKLFGIDAYVLKFDLEKLSKEGSRPFVTLHDILHAQKENIPDNSAIIFATGWGSHWDKPDFLTHNWFLKKDAVEYLIKKKPTIFAADTPSFDNIDAKQGIWDLIFNNNILIVAPLVNVEKIKKFKVKLYVCPIKILKTTGLPCRVIIKEY